MVAIAKSLFAAAAAQYMSWGHGSGDNYDWSMKGQPWSTTGVASCKIDNFVPKLPAGQTQLVVPDKPARFIGLAYGVQNYTCSNTNTYTSAGAVAELIDVSCQAYEPKFDTIQHDLYNVWTHLIPNPIQAIIALFGALNPPEILAQHYFVPNPAGEGLSPKWDFTSSGKFKGNKDAFVLAKGKGKTDAPEDPAKNVPWLDVVNVAGKIADEVFRIDTVGGQPPASCHYSKDKDISVKYVSKYVFYGGSIY